MEYNSEAYDRIEAAKKYLKKDISTSVALIFFATICLFGSAILIYFSILDKGVFSFLFWGLIFVISVGVNINCILEIIKDKKQGKCLRNRDLDMLLTVESRMEASKKLADNIEKNKMQSKEAAKIRREHERKLAHPECPMCKGHNTRRITNVNRAVSVGTLGLASSKIGKTFECLDCKYKW